MSNDPSKKASNMASEKQVNYAISLLSKAGYSTNFMDARFKEFGAKMRQRSGKVRDWLSDMDKHAISQLIDKLHRR